MSLRMTNAEIIAEYKRSKTPMKQIGILADLNCCTRAEIADILRDAGETLPKQYQKVQEAEPAYRLESDDDTPGTYTISETALQVVCMSAMSVISKFSTEAGDDEADAYAFRDRVQGVVTLVMEIKKRLNQS